VQVALMDGGMGVSQNQNARFAALASSVRREIGNKHVCDPWCGLFLFDQEFRC
jgi:hypothetical protein